MPEYVELVKFLLRPFLTDPDALGVDCEYTCDRHRVWIRVAVANGDQGSAFGRGGRNLQAIRTVLQAAATPVAQSIHLDVYGSNTQQRERDSDGERTTHTQPNRRVSTDDRQERPAPNGDSSSRLPPPRPRR